MNTEISIEYSAFIVHGRPTCAGATYLELIDAGPGLVITTSTGKPTWPTTFLYLFMMVIEQIGLSVIRFTDLRHTRATLMLAGGVHPKVVQVLLGSSQISLAGDTYSGNGFIIHTTAKRVEQ